MLRFLSLCILPAVFGQPEEPPSHPNVPLGTQHSIRVQGRRPGTQRLNLPERLTSEDVVLCFENVDLAPGQALTVSGTQAFEFTNQGPSGTGSFCTPPLNGEVEVTLAGEGDGGYDLVGYTNIEDTPVGSSNRPTEKKFEEQLICGTNQIQSTQCLYDNVPTLTVDQQEALELTKATGRHTQCKGTSCSLCTAWFISPSYYLVNYHCVDATTTSAYVELNFRKACGTSFTSGSCSRSTTGSTGSIVTYYGQAVQYWSAYDLTLLKVVTLGGDPSSTTGITKFFSMAYPSDTIIFSNVVFMIHHSQGCSQQITFGGIADRNAGTCCCSGNAKGFNHNLDSFGGSSGSSIVSAWTEGGIRRYAVNSIQHCEYTSCPSSGYQGLSVPASYFASQLAPYLCPIAGCSACNGDNTACVTCHSGFYVVGAGCNQCGAGCSSCTDSSTCIQCTSNYYLNAGACTSCSSAYTAQCITCTSNQCTGCSGGFALSGVNVCTSCSILFSDPSCSTCTSNQCTGCQSGYVLQNNVCVQQQCGICYASCSNQPCCSGYLCYRTGRGCPSRNMCLRSGAQFCDSGCTNSVEADFTSPSPGRSAKVAAVAVGAGALLLGAVAVLVRRHKQAATLAQLEGPTLDLTNVEVIEKY